LATSLSTDLLDGFKGPLVRGGKKEREVRQRGGIQVHDNVEAVKLYSKVDGGTLYFHIEFHNLLLSIG